MSLRKISDRLNLAQTFTSSANPFLIASLYPVNGVKHKNQEEHTQLVSRMPLIQLPKAYSKRQTEGNNATDTLFQMNSTAGEPLTIYDGFTFKICPEADPYIVLCDTQTDPFLAGIIKKAEQVYRPNMSTSELLFYVGLLAFGDWGQTRFPITTLQTSSEKPTGIYLGELILTTCFKDLNCAMLGIAMQVVAQTLVPKINLYTGQAAYFSPHCHEMGSHVWNIVDDNTSGKQIAIDWTIYPPKIEDIFHSAANLPISHLYEKFCKNYGRFPFFYQESHPPTIEQYDDLHNGSDEESGFNSMNGVRNNVVYWSNERIYLGSCHIPKGWDNSRFGN